MTEELLRLTEGLPKRVLAGVSGGADSVALLRLLVLSRHNVTAVHVNHGLRGAASDGDEDFVRGLCEKWQVPLLTFRAAPPEHAGEDWARSARYGFFRDAAEQTGCHALVLAHHQDDQAETVLEHLLRGSGLSGLCGMRPVSERDGLTLYRPLLGTDRASLRLFLKEQDLTWREDESNRDPSYLRNAIRLQVLPLMEQLRPGAARRIAGMGFLLSQDEAHLRHETEAYLLSGACRGNLLKLKNLRQLSPGPLRRVLRLWWESQGGEPLDQEQTEALLRLVNGPAGREYDLPGHRTAYCGQRFLHLLSSKPEPMMLISNKNNVSTGGVPEESRGDWKAPGRSSERNPIGSSLFENSMTAEELPAEDGTSLYGVTLRLLPSEGSFGDGKLTQELPQELLQGCVIRTRRQGDVIRPFGSSGSQSLQDYLVNHRVDAPFRDRIPLIARGNEILMVCGVGTGGLPRLKGNEARIRLCWTGDIPWQP